MSGFQVVALVVLALLLAGNLTVIFRRQVSRRVGLPWAVVWAVAAAAIIWPDSTRLVARAAGIGRGADLILYSFVIVALIGFYMTYVRLRRIDSNLTLLVRHIAIENAENQKGASTPAQPGPEKNGKLKIEN